MKLDFVLVLAWVCSAGVLIVSGSPGREGAHSSYFTSTPAPQICGCGNAISKVVIQEMNQTVMIPEFVPYQKEFARLVAGGFVEVPRFTTSQEIILEPDVQERKVRVVNVNYEWKGVMKRVPIYNRTTLQIDVYQLDKPTEYVNHIVERIPTPVYETEVNVEDGEIEQVVVRENLTVLRPEVFEFEDYPLVIDEVFFQDVIEYVEKIEYKETPVYVWQIELYDEDFFQKNIQEKTANVVAVDELKITRRAVPVPVLKYRENPNPILIHEPVEIRRQPVPDPEFHNQTYKVAVETRKVIPIPVYQDVPVEVPTYYRSPCELPRGSSSSFVPPTCSCNMCKPCTVCPTESYPNPNPRPNPAPFPNRIPVPQQTPIQIPVRQPAPAPSFGQGWGNQGQQQSQRLQQHQQQQGPYSPSVVGNDLAFSGNTNFVPPTTRPNPFNFGSSNPFQFNRQSRRTSLFAPRPAPEFLTETSSNLSGNVVNFVQDPQPKKPSPTSPPGIPVSSNKVELKKVGNNNNNNTPSLSPTPSSTLASRQHWQWIARGASSLDSNLWGRSAKAFGALGFTG